MKPVDVKTNTDNDSTKEINNKDPKFKVGDIVKIPKYKNILAKSYSSNWSDEAFVPWTYAINDLNGKEIVGTFYENESQKTNQKEFRIEKVIKRKDDKLYVKSKGYSNLFKSWIDKKDIV